MDVLHIAQVLAFKDPSKCPEIGPALWAALQEIEIFYNLTETRVQCRRYFLNPDSQPELLEECPGPDRMETIGKASNAPSGFWTQVQGKFRGTVHQGMLADQVRRLVPTEQWLLLIVTDQEIQPPPEWRYIIWDGTPHGGVISVAPTDPQYWRERSANRVGAIKHRVRTAGMSIVGEWLGLERCENHECFLYSDVSSVDVLDSMLVLGKEHNWPRLAGLGYSPRPKDPAQIQTVQRGMLTHEESPSAFADEGEEWNTYE
jgi:hypothetical protein